MSDFKAFQKLSEQHQRFLKMCEEFKPTTYKEKHICCICGKEYEGYGNNAYPVVGGRCCDECNRNVVIPTRLGMTFNEN